MGRVCTNLYEGLTEINWLLYIQEKTLISSIWYLVDTTQQFSLELIPCIQQSSPQIRITNPVVATIHLVEPAI